MRCRPCRAHPQAEVVEAQRVSRAARRRARRDERRAADIMRRGHRRAHHRRHRLRTRPARPRARASTTIGEAWSSTESDSALSPSRPLFGGDFRPDVARARCDECGSNRGWVWDCCGRVSRGQRRIFTLLFGKRSLAHGDLQPRILFSANIQTLPLDAELQPPAAMASCGGSSCGDSNNGGTAWSVHDGQFFANHVHNSSPAVPNEHRFMMLPPIGETSTRSSISRDLKVSLERLEGSGPPNDSPSLRRAASAAVRHEPSIQRRWSVHDGLFFARHCRLNAPSTMNERLWLLRIGELPARHLRGRRRQGRRPDGCAGRRRCRCRGLRGGGCDGSIVAAAARSPRPRRRAARCIPAHRRRRCPRRRCRRDRGDGATADGTSGPFVGLARDTRAGGAWTS